MKMTGKKITGLISMVLALVIAMSAINVFAQTEVQNPDANAGATAAPDVTVSAAPSIVPSIVPSALPNEPTALEKAIENGQKYIKGALVDGKYTSWWDALASGEDFVNSETAASKVVFPEIAAESKINDYINAIMLANVTGLNTAKADEWAEKLASMQGEDGAFGTLVNQHIFAMIALNYNNQAYDVDAAIYKMIDWMLSGDVDTDYIAFAIIALSDLNTPSRPFVQGYIDVLVMAMNQARKEGGYNSLWSGVNTNTTACALAALSIAGVDYKADSYVINGKNPMDDLMAAQLSDGSFKYLAADEKGNHMAAQQAIIALRIADAKSKNAKLLPVVNRAENKTVSITVLGKTGEILSLDKFTADVSKATSANAGLSFEDVLKQALDANSIKYDIKPSQYGGNYISGINGDTEGAFGGYDGWLCLQNGVSLPTSFSTVYVENNDVLTVYYGDFSVTKNLSVSLENKVMLVGIDAILKVTTKEDVYDDSWNYVRTDVKPVEGVKLEAFGKTYTSDAEGKIVIPAADITAAGLADLKFSKWQDKAVAGAVGMNLKACVLDLSAYLPAEPEVVEVKKVKFVKKTIKVKVGKKATLRVKLTPSKGVKKAQKKVTWSINKKGKKVIKFVKKTKALNGKLKAVIKAKKKGVAKVTCTAPSGKKATCTVKVVKKK